MLPLSNLRISKLGTYNPSYSGGRDQEDHGLKPALANSSRDPISKIPNTVRHWWLTTVILATQ
jgi:hypothetical protein